MGAWQSARAKRILAAPLLLVLSIVIILAVRLSGTSSNEATPIRHSSTKVASVVPSYKPLRVVPRQTAIERTVNHGFAQLWRGESASTAAKLPSAATSANYPAIDATDARAPSTFALAFTQELLDIDFAESTRQELLAWASYNDAPNSTVTMPVAINLKVLPASLTMNPTPIPTASQWNRLAAARASWGVSGLVTSVSPIWTELLATGWQPVDPLMTMYDVSGTLTVTTPGHGPDVESFFFLLTLGGASWHPGYGAVVMNNWTVN
jgi:hypothetical protein